VMIAVVLVGVVAQPASADEDRNRSGQYLALGDSLPFGYSPLVDPTNAANFVGYPELAAPALKLALTNASCPGQTSSGFISLTGTDNGCFQARNAGLPLHTAYSGSQLDFAVWYLRSHPHTRLVTLTIGANNLLLCAQNTPDMCASPTEIAGVLTSYQQDLTTILTKIRKVYHHQLVAVTYYSTDYRNTQVTGLIKALNDVTTQVTRSFHGTIADGFAAFATVAAGSGGDTCAAGLLIKLSDGTCNKHPTTVGAQLLADTLTAAVRHHGPDDGDNEDALVAANG
jgi:hypothetical protein